MVLGLRYVQTSTVVVGGRGVSLVVVGVVVGVVVMGVVVGVVVGVVEVVVDSVVVGEPIREEKCDNITQRIMVYDVVCINFELKNFSKH